MGRNQKVTAAEVKEYLEENPAVTIGQMADNFNVSKPTIRSRKRTLLEGGEPIIHGKDGIRLISREELTDADVAEAMAAFLKWNLKMISAIHMMSTPMKPLLPALKRTLRVDYLPEERRALATCCQRIKALIDWVEIDQEME